MPEAFGNDLQSMQEARDLVAQAQRAEEALARLNQYQIDLICVSMAEAAFQAAERLGRMAVEETGMGVAEHKAIKNQFASRDVWASIKDIRTEGVIRRDDERRIIEIAWPFGVIAALVPTTNPTSTAIFKALVAVKARNAIVIAPHPSAPKCTAEAVRVLAEAAEAAGAPKGTVSCMTRISLEGTQELLRQKAVRLIIATGGEAMVEYAHSVGKPALGVGPGNVPVYVDRSADVAKAAKDIVNSVNFDYAVICAHEGAVIADAPVAEALARAMEAQGAHFLTAEQAGRLAKVMFRPNGLMQAGFVGRSPQAIAAMAGFEVPDTARILVARCDRIGPAEPLSREKLAPVLAFYVAEGWRAGCERCIEMLNFGGKGHTLGIHCGEEEVILQFGLQKPAFRIVVNSSTTAGAIGFTTGLMPSLTLATGGMGGGISSDNITVQHLMNVKRVAYGLRSFDPPVVYDRKAAPAAAPAAPGRPSAAELEAVVRMVVQEALARK
ncbi:MAG TPA: aldehyde dehydrogenase family protein [Spirochaetales bacterium]|nr:aldehyde dehydrogenase family protein [Spirochaetales bacterium]HRY53386.1 aldehyde dehydrogenase family protein [Spirochaetia bacterium]